MCNQEYAINKLFYQNLRENIPKIEPRKVRGQQLNYMLLYPHQIIHNHLYTVRGQKKIATN